MNQVYIIAFLVDCNQIKTKTEKNYEWYQSNNTAV